MIRQIIKEYFEPMKHWEFWVIVLLGVIAIAAYANAGGDVPFDDDQRLIEQWDQTQPQIDPGYDYQFTPQPSYNFQWRPDDYGGNCDWLYLHDPQAYYTVCEPN